METGCNMINCHQVGRICVPKTDLPRIVIVGGGFAGLNLINGLKDQSVQIVLIDKNNYHQFQPLLYQVATSGIEPDNIVFPFRKLFGKNTNVVYRMADAMRVVPADNQIITSIGAIDYDYLVLAGGSVTNYFGNMGFGRFGLGLKTVTDALDLRSKLLQNLERATVTCIKEEKVALSSIVIVGGGATGVELAGALAEFRRYILPKDYPELKDIGMKVFLTEASCKLLQSMPERLSDKTFRYLTDLNVHVLLDSAVESYDGKNVVFQNGKILPTANFVWTAGVKGNIIDGLSNEVITKQGRIHVDQNNRVLGEKNIFAIGDIASMSTESYPKGHPMVAQVAIQQGKNLAGNLIKTVQKESMVPFRYRDRGALATIGKRKAVASIRKMEFGGIGAWLIWSFIHLMSIIGVRNKALVAVNWLWSYFTYDRGDRVIIREFKQDKQKNILNKSDNVRKLSSKGHPKTD